MATSNCFYVSSSSSSPLLRLCSSSVANQLPFLSPRNGRRFPAKSFDLPIVSSQNLSVYPPSATVAEARVAGEREPMTPPYNVLITGSTKGIGYALAKEFLKTGDNVVICSRSAERVESVVQSFKEKFGDQHAGLLHMVQTKRSVVHLTKSLQAELQMQDVKNVVVHNLSPGMVTTDLLMSGAKIIINKPNIIEHGK